MTWRTQAACRNTDTDIFFDPTRTEEALNICDRCPVILDCREYATHYPGAINEIQGIWGGKTDKQIQRTRARNPRAANPRLTLKPCGTYAAYRRHLKYGTPPCHACQQANQQRRTA